MRTREPETSRVQVRVRRNAAKPSRLGVPRVFLERRLRRRLGHYVVARRRVPIVPGELSAILQTRYFSPSETDEGGPDPRVQMDVAGRAALGISEREAEAHDIEVTLERLRIGWRRRSQELVARIFGVRYVTHRVVLSIPIDADRPVVRVDRTALDLLGCDSGDRVVLTAPARDVAASSACSVTAQVFEIPQAEIAERERRESSSDVGDARYRSFRHELGLEFDVPRIFVPGNVRKALDLDHGDTLLVRREIPSLFGRSFREFGLLVLLSALAVAQLPTPIDAGWGATAALVLLAISLGLFFTGASIRSRVRGSRRWQGARSGRSVVASSDAVWYAGYGSNLLPDRFLCYLEGGRTEGMGIANPGARDRTPYRGRVAGTIPGRLRFAGSFTSWGGEERGAGAAMLDPDAETGVAVQAVAYRITVEQLVDVVLQECGFDPRDLDSIDMRDAVERDISQHLEHLNAGGPLRASVRGSGFPEVRPIMLCDSAYGRLVSLPMRCADGTVRTVHAVLPVADEPSNPPSEAYRATMRAGLIEAVGLSPDAADAYLASIVSGSEREER